MRDDAMPAPPVTQGVLLRAERLSKRFPVSGKRNAELYAVDDIDLEIGVGESVGLVGESGCGKSTLVRLLARLLDPSDGRIVFDGHEIGAADRKTGARAFARHPLRGRIQMVFQDPTDSLNPRFTARQAIAEPLRLLANLDGARIKSRIDKRVDEVAAQVGLPPELLGRFPHQLSGGQKARVGIARALALRHDNNESQLVILDEPTSALDVSVQAVVLQLLGRLRRELNLSYLFVSHDLNVVRLLTDRVVVMYLGRVVEAGPVAEVLARPRHPYTQALVDAIPGPARASCSGAPERIRLTGEVRSPIDPPAHVCRFYGRCPRSAPRCAHEMPQLAQVGERHIVACHFADPV
jgi:oligopeptide/dipeptide ABC transporter ATP-binding protein